MNLLNAFHRTNLVSLKAYSLLQANAELLPVIQKQFRKDFIDNFIEGTSIFSV